MKIYSFQTFRLTKVLYTAEEVGQDYELILLNPQKGEHKAPEHLARQPLGRVPAIEWQGETFFESNSICRLLAEINNNQLYGTTPMQHARVNQWVDFVTQHLSNHMMTFAWQEAVRVQFFGQQTEAEACVTAQASLNDLLPVLEKPLGQYEFLAGDAISIADTILLAYAQIETFTSLELEAFPNLWRWYQMMNKRPAIQRALDRLPGRGIFSFLAQA